MSGVRAILLSADDDVIQDYWIESPMPVLRMAVFDAFSLDCPDDSEPPRPLHRVVEFVVDRTDTLAHQLLYGPDVRVYRQAGMSIRG